MHEMAAHALLALHNLAVLDAFRRGSMMATLHTTTWQLPMSPQHWPGHGHSLGHSTGAYPMRGDATGRSLG
jgi:hypothetical protein